MKPGPELPAFGRGRISAVLRFRQSEPVMLYPMRISHRRRPVALATALAAFILGAGILGAGGARAPVRAQYPSNFEPYNAYYYSLHAPYYYYVAPEAAP